jgi:hypothetical protein
MHTEFWSEDLTGRDHQGDVTVDDRIILKRNLKIIG